ncbi:MAG: hypothetical protein PHG66_04735 [Candidatus Colwellbacteria bacterium]|nr:hypothetical protein [Candidatus Colwellbacteria bacterium]
MVYPSDILNLIISYTSLYDILIDIFKTGMKRTVFCVDNDTVEEIVKLTLQCMRIEYKDVTSRDQDGDLLFIPRRGREGIDIRGAKRLVTVCQRPRNPQIVGRAIRGHSVSDLESCCIYNRSVIIHSNQR